MLRLVHELEVHQIELELQQEELTRTRVEVEESLVLLTFHFSTIACKRYHRFKFTDSVSDCCYLPLC